MGEGEGGAVCRAGNAVEVLTTRGHRAAASGGSHPRKHLDSWGGAKGLPPSCQGLD